MFTVEEIKQLFHTHSCQRIPYVETTPIQDDVDSLFLKFQMYSHHCFLLESSIRDRYSYIGYDPKLEISLIDHTLKIADPEEHTIVRSKIEQIQEGLDPILSQYRTLDQYPFFCGGLVGYFAYETIHYNEPSLELNMDPDFKDMDLMLFDSLICYDHLEKQVHLIAGIHRDSIEESYQEAYRTIQVMKQIIETGQPKKNRPLQILGPLEPIRTKEQYMEMVDRAKAYIRSGDLFQIVLSNLYTASACGSLFSLYQDLKAQEPSPYLFYFSSDDIEIAGASPETLVQVSEGKVTTFPLAGTRRRGRTPQEDLRLEQELLADEKEVAEHSMLVDLGRNDIGKVSIPGSVVQTRAMDILRFSQVMHIGSCVQGILDQEHSALDALMATLPAGTLSGAPKYRACQIIQELEQDRRGLYGGAFGYIDFADRLDFCIAIRLAYKKQGKIVVRSGAGIVYDSYPENEYKECQNKARAILRILKGDHHDLAYR